MNKDKTPTLDEVFFEEYTSREAILKYTKATAGYGISYLLDHDYKDVYLAALENLPPETRQRGIRMLEFGCGGGMNLVHLIAVLKEAGIKIEKALGTDFSPVLIEAAKRESSTYLPREDHRKIDFLVASNENLINDISEITGTEREQLISSFDFILGVNTMRYCHRGGRETNCVRDIMDLLAPGGVCVNVDMSNRFPAFRSTLKNIFRQREVGECYIPSLEEYTAPFERLGFEILRKEAFCWIPHSGGKLLCGALRVMSPVLNTIARSRAMRSLVVARKAARTR